MLGHLRANLWLLVVSVVLCCVAYPLALWGIGQAVFHDRAEGSLIIGSDGKPVGSRLIAQGFSKDQYFQPRPSAASYNGAASGGSNWAASNPLLRDRAARIIGPIAKYRGGPNKGKPVGPDIEAWFKQQPPEFVTKWAEDHGTLAEQWIKDNPEVTAAFLGKTDDAVKNATGDAAKEFWPAYAKKNPGTWPTVEEIKGPDDKVSKKLKPVQEGSDVQSYLFDVWLQAHPQAELEAVPADMVMASGSGLDPHITVQNALYQMDRVVGAWAEKTKADPAAVRKEIEKILLEKREAPLGGVVGVPLVNVLEMNLAMDERLPKLK